MPFSKCPICTFPHRLRTNPGPRSESMIFYSIKILECVSTVVFNQLQTVNTSWKIVLKLGLYIQNGHRSTDPSVPFVTYSSILTSAKCLFGLCLFDLESCLSREIWRRRETPVLVPCTLQISRYFLAASGLVWNCQWWTRWFCHQRGHTWETWQLSRVPRRKKQKTSMQTWCLPDIFRDRSPTLASCGTW